MKKRTTIILCLALLTVAVVTVSLFMITDTKGNDRKKNADSPEETEVAGIMLGKADDQEKMPLDSDTIYTDENNNTYYINNDNGYLELVIGGDVPDNSIAVQSASILSDDEIIGVAKEYISKWYDDCESDKFGWSIEPDGDMGKRIYMRQMQNGKEIGTIAAVTYDNSGNLISGSFWFDAVLSEADIEDIISEEKALELAGNILESRYNTSSDMFNKVTVDTNTHGGHNYWYITYVSDGEIVNGYVIEIEKLTGEEGNISQLK